MLFTCHKIVKTAISRQIEYGGELFDQQLKCDDVVFETASAKVDLMVA